MQKNNIVLFGNFQIEMEEIESNIVEYFPQHITYEIVTYKKNRLIENSYSYEEFINDNLVMIEKLNIHHFMKSYSDINFYLPVVAERFMSDYYASDGIIGNKDYSYEDILKIIISFILFFDKKIKEATIVFTSYADNFISTIVYLLSKKNNKTCLAFHPIRIIGNDDNFLIDGLSGSPYKDLILKNKLDNIEDAKKILLNNNYIEDAKKINKNLKGAKKGIFNIISPNILSLKYLKFSIFGYKPEKKTLFKYLNLNKPSIPKKIYSNIFRTINKIRAIIYFKFHTNCVKKDYKYIYFPLQVQPEASTSVRAPYFMNMLYTIETISKSLPLGYKLLIKEHPKALGNRNINFYKNIKKFPNIELVNMDYAGIELLKMSEMVIGYGGTTLFESILQGKKVLLLGDFYYEKSLLIRKINSTVTLFDEIQNFLKVEYSQEELNEDLYNMLNYFYQRSFSFLNNFEKNIANNLIKIYEMEKNNEK